MSALKGPQTFNLTETGARIGEEEKKQLDEDKALLLEKNAAIFRTKQNKNTNKSICNPCLIVTASVAIATIAIKIAYIYLLTKEPNL